MSLETIKRTVQCLRMINSGYCLRREMKNTDKSLKNIFYVILLKLDSIETSYNVQK